MISGLDIARSVAHHYKAHWQLAVKSAGLNAYLERETNYENTVSTSVFTLAIISAAQDFQYGALTEYDIVPSITRNSKKDLVDIVWVTELPNKPATREASLSRKIVLGSEIEMGDNQLRAINRLAKLADILRFGS